MRTVSVLAVESTACEVQMGDAVLCSVGERLGGRLVIENVIGSEVMRRRN